MHFYDGRTRPSTFPCFPCAICTGCAGSSPLFACLVQLATNAISSPELFDHLAVSSHLPSSVFFVASDSLHMSSMASMAYDYSFFSSLWFGCCWHVSGFWILQSLTYFSRMMLHDYELKALYAIDIFRLSPSQGKEFLYLTCDPSFAAQGCCTSLCNSFTMTKGPLIETDHRSTKTIGILESFFWFTARAHRVPPLRDIDPNGGTWYQSNRYYASSLSEGVCTRRNALI